MAVATKPIANTADRLIAEYRREEEHWMPHELFGEFLGCSGNMLAGTVARCSTKLLSPRGCSVAAVRRMAETTIRELVERGNASDIERFLATQADLRAEYESGRLLAHLHAGLDRLAALPDARASLETIAAEIDELVAAQRSHPLQAIVELVKDDGEAQVAAVALMRSMKPGGAS